MRLSNFSGFFEAIQRGNLSDVTERATHGKYACRGMTVVAISGVELAKLSNYLSSAWSLKSHRIRLTRRRLNCTRSSQTGTDTRTGGETVILLHVCVTQHQHRISKSFHCINGRLQTWHDRSVRNYRRKSNYGTIDVSGMCCTKQVRQWWPISSKCHAAIRNLLQYFLSLELGQFRETPG